MEITGKIINILQAVSGEGKNGNPWKKQEFVLEYQSGQYPKKFCFSLWGDKIDSTRINVGDDMKVFFDVESREYNGKYFTDIRAWKVEKQDSSNSTPPPVYEPIKETEGDPFTSPISNNNDSVGDDLPF